MADPVSMGVMVGLQAVSNVSSAVSGYRADRANAAALDANAHAAQVDGAAQEVDILHRTRAIQGDALVAQASSGVSLGTGSALEMLRQNALNAHLDILSARSTAAGKASAYSRQAADKRAAARAGLISGIIGAGTKALGGYTDIRGMSPSIPKVTAGPSLPVPAGLGFSPYDLSSSSSLVDPRSQGITPAPNVNY